MISKNKKIKVCFLTFLAYPLFNHQVKSVFGGAEIDLYNLAKKMSENEKYDITFIVGDYGQQVEEFYGKIKVRKFKYFNLDTYRNVRFKILRQLIIWKELLRMDADVYVTEASSELLGWLAVISKKIKGKKILFRLAHDLDTDFVDTRSKSLKLFLLYKYGINNSDVIISQTDRQKSMLKENIGLDSRIIKNGFFVNESIDFSKKKYILWVARAENWKRPEKFLELAKRIPEERFVMIMPGKNPLKDKVRELSNQIPNLQLIDYVPFRDVQGYYDEAKLFVNTSDYEGFPNAFVQSCLGKTPILSFNVNPDDFINTNRLGYMCNDSLDEAERFIRQLDAQRLRMFGENAFQYVMNHHNISTISEEYEEIIDGLVG